MILDLTRNHESVLERVSKLGFKLDHFFDIGAAKGMWGKLIRKHWPACFIHFFEAAPAWEPILKNEADSVGGNVRVNIAAAGDLDGLTYFRYDPKNPFGGAIVDKPGENTIQVPKITLDSYSKQYSPSGRYCLKLDVHGAERLILSGAAQFMKSCDLVIFETYNFGPAHRRFGQMAVFLEEEFGLRCFDIAEPKCRPYDKALWQMDMYFARPEGTTLSEWRLYTELHLRLRKLVRTIQIHNLSI